MTTQTEQTNKKDLWSKVKHGVYEVKQRTVTGSKNTKEAIKIQQAKLKMVERKKNFGLEYMNLIDNGASDDELQDCLDKAKEDVDRLHEKIDRWSRAMADNRERMERKISLAPSPTTITSRHISESDSEDSEENSLASVDSIDETEEETEDLEDDSNSVRKEEKETQKEDDRSFDEALEALRQIIEKKEERVEQSLMHGKADTSTLESDMDDEEYEEEDEDEDEEEEIEVYPECDESIEIPGGEFLRSITEETEAPASKSESSVPMKKPVHAITSRDDERPFDEATVAEPTAANKPEVKAVLY